MATEFTVERFKETFADSLSFQESPVKDGKKRILGTSKLVHLELMENQKGILESAVLVFPYFLADKEMNRQVSAQAIRFLELCLPPLIAPVTWIEEAKQNLEIKEVVEYERKYEELTVTLMHMKDKPMFYLMAERG